MAKRKTGREWRAFLRALGRTGNARVSAAAAGMDVATAYDRRKRDPDLAAKWAAALEAARAKGPVGRPLRRLGNGPELVPRASKRGCQLVRAAPGRWSAAVEEAFFAALARTGCVRSAAALARISTTALYYRRKKYPACAARWDATLAQAKQRIPELLNAAAIASLDPEIGGEGLPIVNVDQAIAIARLKCGEGGTARKRSRYVPPEPTVEEVRDEVMRRIAAIRRHRDKGTDQ